MARTIGLTFPKEEVKVAVEPISEVLVESEPATKEKGRSRKTSDKK